MFKKARPIWPLGREQEVNCRVQFKAVCPKTASAELWVATSGIYQLYINGEFVAYGPARAGKDHFRMDTLNICRYLTKSENTVVIEVAGYYCKSYYVQQQDSFLQAQIVSGDRVLAATGTDFSARLHPYYIRKIQRYSFQRPFAESYRNVDPMDSFLTDTVPGTEPLCVTADKTIIPRHAPYPLYETARATAVLSGTVRRVQPQHYCYSRYCLRVGFREGLPTGWSVKELDCIPEKDWQELECTPGDHTPADKLPDGRYNIYTLPRNVSGMITLTVTCEEASTVYLSFDELLTNEAVDPRRLQCCNIIRYDLQAGTHKLHTFEVYTLKYLQVSVLGAPIKITDVAVREYKHPPVPVPQYDDPQLQMIADAAVETYRQNAVDLFTDCPSRERAGWLCDSFFTARTEYALTGRSTIEESFLENFLHETVYGKIPAGMLPMCYPADHLYGRYIPNWAMWLVVELLDYKKRTGKTELIQLFKTKVYALLDFFQSFENEDGLLEDLRSWVFVEWSRANDAAMVEGVNYPSNMMYYAAMAAAAALYSDPALKVRAENIRQKINEQSFDGEFYVDRAVRTSEGLFPVPESTEVCQYYAFFTGVATAESHGALYDCLVRDFGPQRDLSAAYPHVHKAAPFIGNYLRLEILMRGGHKQEVLDNIKGYFSYMAQRTGTLWEKAETTASCNHGFASCVLWWLKDM